MNVRQSVHSISNEWVKQKSFMVMRRAFGHPAINTMNFYRGDDDEGHFLSTLIGVTLPV